MPNKEQIVVTGSNGMVASRFIEILSPKYSFIGMGRSNEPNHSSNGLSSYLQCDITNHRQLERIISETPAETIIHTAAVVDIEGSEKSRTEGTRSLIWAVNVDATKHVAQLATKYNKRVLLVSTYLVFDGQNGPYNECSPTPLIPENLSWYGWTKLRAEEELMSTGNNWTILRLPTIYSANFPGKMDLARFIVKKLASGENIDMTGNQLFNPMLVDRVADGLDILIRDHHQGVFHISPSDYTTPFGFAQIIGSQLTAEVSEDNIRETTYIRNSNSAPRPLDGRLTMNRLISLGYQPNDISTDVLLFLNQLSSSQSEQTSP